METKNKIINAAYGLFAAKGMEFSLNEIAETVGIKKASIYAHFPSKDELLYQLFNEEIDKYFIIEQNSNTLKELYFGIVNFYGSSKEKLLFWKRLLLLPPSTIESEIRERIVNLSESRFQKAKALICKESPPSIKSEKDVDVLAVLFLSFVHGLLSSEIIYSKYNIEDYKNKEWTLFERILKKEE